MSGYEMGSNDPVEFHHGTFFTTVQDDVVQLVENDTATDTIFYFGAEIGDRWHGSPISDIEARYRYVVEDLGTKLLNGTSVKWWYIDIQLGMLDMFDHFTYDTLYERIGFVDAFIIPSHTHVFLEIPAIHGTNCYGDGEVVWSWTPWLNCALTLASPKIDSPQKMLVIRPNPATEKFWIDWPDGVSLGKDPYLTLYDGRGSLIKRARIVDRELPIDLTGSVPGLYHVEINSSDSFQMVTRLVVE